MGQLVFPPTGRICVDTAALIYHVERIEPFYSAAANMWSLVAAGQLEVTVSELALLEVLVKPLQLRNDSLADLYRRVVTATAGINCRPIDSLVLEKAAAIRAESKLRTPDAIHAATALLENCDCFITNDLSFRRIAGLNVIVLSEWINT